MKREREREREGKTTQKRLQHAREQLTPEAQGHPTPASRPLFCRQRACLQRGSQAPHSEDSSWSVELTAALHELAVAVAAVTVSLAVAVAAADAVAVAAAAVAAAAAALNV